MERKKCLVLEALVLSIILNRILNHSPKVQGRLQKFMVGEAKGPLMHMTQVGWLQWEASVPYLSLRLGGRCLPYMSMGGEGGGVITPPAFPLELPLKWMIFPKAAGWGKYLPPRYSINKRLQ